MHTEAHRMYPVTRLVSVNSDGTDTKVLMKRQLERIRTQYQDRVDMLDRVGAFLDRNMRSESAVP